jgi:hypothetical protein
LVKSARDSCIQSSSDRINSTSPASPVRSPSFFRIPASQYRSHRAGYSPRASEAMATAFSWSESRIGRVRPRAGVREPPPQPRDQTTLGSLRGCCVTTHSNGTGEENSLGMIRLHFGHFCRLLGEAFPLPELTLLRLQEYIDGWARKGLSPITLRKDVTTIRCKERSGNPRSLPTGSWRRKASILENSADALLQIKSFCLYYVMA